MGQLIEKGFKVTFEDKYCLIKDAADQDIFKVKMKGKSFSLHPLKEEQSAFLLKEDVTQIWHKSRTLSSSRFTATKRKGADT